MTSISRSLSKLMTNLRRWVEYFQLSETIILWGLAFLVGLATGVGVWLFKLLINAVHLLGYTELGTWLTSVGSWTLFILPVLGGLLVSLIIHCWVKKNTAVLPEY